MRIGIRAKILVPVFISVASVTAAVTWVLGEAMSTKMHEEYLSKGTALVKGLASNAQDALQNRDASWTQGFIDEYKSIKGVAHVYVLNQDGKVVVHTFVPIFPASLLSGAHTSDAKLNSDIVTKEVTIGGKKRLNIQVPILMGTLGTAVVGMDLDLLESELHYAVRRVILIGAAIGFLACTFLLWLLSHPIDSILYLSSVSQRVRQGEDVYPDKKRFSKDEIGELGGSFDEMLKNLQYQKKNLEKIVGERTADLLKANQSIDAMINSVGQGFLAFDRTGISQPNYSKACTDLLECEPSGKFLWDVFKVPPEHLENFKYWVGTLFDEPLTFESLTEIGPKTFKHSNTERQISIEYKPIRDDKGRVHTVVLIATDRSAEHAAKMAAERERAFASMVVKIVKERDYFLSFARESRECIRQMEMAITNSLKNNMELGSLIREVHTLKGGAAAFSLLTVKELAHKLESTLGRLNTSLEDELTAFLPTMRDETEKIKAALEEILGIARGILGKSTDESQRHVEIPMTNLQGFSDEIESLNDLRKIKSRFIQQFMVEPIGKFFSHFDTFAHDLAARQGKELAPFTFVNSEMPIVAEPYLSLFNSMIHAFRNSVDHALEMPFEREEAGKAPAGNMEIRFEQENSGIKITIHDDGRGVDIEALRAKLKVQNRMDWLAKSDEEILQVLFESGLSTRDKVTDLSGRGVGLDAIRHEAEKLGGDVRITSMAGASTTLIIWVPDINAGRVPDSIKAA